ncbi:MAG: ABC transporter ATP-binding protein [Thermofilum sp. ex4484_79]|nr:MAG: ABC transporter ATP-binding protein [Thermofilum sp. ex4484_79]
MIEAVNLGFKYLNSSNKILSNISFRIRENELVLILGPSASGKTTLAYCISGIIPHIIDGELEGKVLIQGKDIQDLEFSEISRKVGVVLQNPEAQIFGMTVEEDIAFGLENLGFDTDTIREKIDHWLGMFDLLEYKKINPRFLSGGQKQKLVIASVMAMDPEIIILDEPFVNLDQKGKVTLLKTLFKSKKNGKTIILIDKKVPNFLELVDRVIILSQEGRLLFASTPNKFLKIMDSFSNLGIFAPRDQPVKLVSVR